MTSLEAPVTGLPTRDQQSALRGHGQASRRLVVTERDRQIVDTTVRLGAATSRTLRLLRAPGIHPATFRRRIGLLHQSGLLRQHRHIGPAGAVWLYSTGPAALAAGQPRPWRPSFSQLGHTVLVAETLLALLDRNLAPGWLVDEWHGEAEIRAWHRLGHPRPDLQVHWIGAEVEKTSAPSAWFAVELDRGTEGGAVWRRVLTRYLVHHLDAQVLVVATTDTRARRVAEVAATLGVRVVALSSAALRDGGDPAAYQARGRRRRPLSQTLAQS